MNANARQPQRVEFILQQLDELPTLDLVAARLLDLTSDEESSSEEVIALIASDPALSSKVLKLSRFADPNRGGTITTIDRAVLHLGFEAVRSAVLSAQIFNYFDPATRSADETASETPLFEREAFWHHSLAVASLTAGLLSARNPKLDITPAEGFLAGLLHDLGMLVLHTLLPRSFDRVCQLAESHAISIDQACSRVIGVTTKTAGKRLAERWQLPRKLGDVLWLHGQPMKSIPDLPHRPLIGLVTLGDCIARMHYTTPIGHMYRGESWTNLAEHLGIAPSAVERRIEQLPQEVSQRAEALGMNVEPDHKQLLRCVTRANQALGRINLSARKRVDLSQSQSRVLHTISEFHATQAPGDSVFTVLEKVVHSARAYFGEGFYAILHQAKPDEPWQLIQFAKSDQDIRSELIDPPAGSSVIADLADNVQISMQVAAMLPWLSDYLTNASDIREVRLLPLRCGWGVSAVLLHDRPLDGTDATRHQQLDALSRTWAGAIAAARQHEGARALGEQLAESNRMLLETQDELTQQQTMAALGELAAGAAHEMNNPLTIISGRAQQLLEEIGHTEHRQHVQQILTQSHKLSDMITALHTFAKPVTPHRHVVDVHGLAVRISRAFKPTRRHPFEIITVVQDSGDSSETNKQECADNQCGPVESRSVPAHAWIDPDLIGQALMELVQNAIESKGSQHIELRVQTGGPDDRLKIRVRDDGSGLSDAALTHAFDPFFSEKEAGRQTGLGLSRARRLVEAHGGLITLENNPQGGAVATIILDHWQQQQDEMEQRAA